VTMTMSTRELTGSEDLIDPDLESEEEQARLEYSQLESTLTLVNPTNLNTESDPPATEPGFVINLPDDDPPSLPEF
jgi:hypothetical protein